MGMSYEEKMRIIQNAQPGTEDILLNKVLKGEIVDITKSEELFHVVNNQAGTTSMEQALQRQKFEKTAQNIKEDKEGLYDVKFGKTKDKKMRWLGDIPAELYFTRPEFSPMLPKEEREANIRKFLNQFSAFRAGDKRV